MTSRVWSEADRVIAFIERYCKLSKNKRFKLREWQKSVVREMYSSIINDAAERVRKYIKFLLGIPRKNGKSTLVAALALYHLFADPYESTPVVVSAAGDRRQAKMVFDEAKRMIRACPALKRHAKIYSNRIECTRSGGVYLAASADAGLWHGLNPTFVVFDEVHVFKNEDLIEALTTGSSMRRSPMFVFITTAGVIGDTPLYRMYSYGRKIESGDVHDPTFGFRWYGPKEGEKFNPKDPAVWARFNPSFDLMNKRVFESALRSLSLNAFIRFHLNGWTEAISAFLPHGAWDELAREDDPLMPGDDVSLGFDGAFHKDCTAIVATRLRDRKIFVLNVWERPPDADENWHTPVDEVDEAFRVAWVTYNVVTVVCDPYWFTDTFTRLEKDGLPILAFRSNVPSRICPATQHFYQAVINQTVFHDGHPGLALHLRNAHVKEDNYGMRIVKDPNDPKKKIDIAMAALLSLWGVHMYQPPEPVREMELIYIE